LVKNILSTKEREIMQEYLTTGKKLDDFRVILHRAKKINLEVVETDAELIRQFLAKVEQTKKE